jgi:ferredoxin
MCEFCTEHGEGKKWYLQMKNYSDELLFQELTSTQKDIIKADSRLEWRDKFYEKTVIPACRNVKKLNIAMKSGSQPATKLSEEEALAQRKFMHFGQVLPLEDVEKVIDMVDSITRMPCGCRYKTTGKEDKRYCFGIGVDKLGILGKYPDAASSLEVLNKEETKELFRKFDEEGLIHSIWSNVTPYIGAICNCDRDCLPYYLGYITQERIPSFFRAEYVCKVDWDLCTGCKSCMAQCQFGAQFYSSTLSKVDINPARCFGCGVCRAVCPTDAISLVPKENIPEIADIWLRNVRS